MTLSFEIGPIRPPSEAYSLLFRVNRNCPWNKCYFCSLYKDRKFEFRRVSDVKGDILTAKSIKNKITEIAFKSKKDIKEIAAQIIDDPPSEAYRNVAIWLYGGGENVFLQDANALLMKTDDLAEVIRFIRETFPSVRRITTYGRSQTASRKKPAEFLKLREAGLSRIHIGMETGYDPLLKYMNKGVTSAEHVIGGKRIVESRISLCEYVVLGLGGLVMSKEHALDTARVLNRIAPDFIRVRTLCVNSHMPLYDEVIRGRFIRANDEEIVGEERILIDNLDCHSFFVSDHVSNLLPEIEGKLPDDKGKLLSVLYRFEALSDAYKANFILGRRTNVYYSLDDMKDSRKYNLVEQVKDKLSKADKTLFYKAIFKLMEELV